ncbi:MAG: COQ9 family protein [Emcibacteraceae bacterium]
MSKKTSDKTPDEYRDSLLEAALDHVAFDGWSEKTLNQAAENIGISSAIVDLAFPDGVIEMIDFYAQKCDIAMVHQAAKIDLNSLKIREKITALVKFRLLSEQPHKEAVRRTVAFLALPGNYYTSLRILYRTVDLIWKTINDTSTDFNFYTKRMTLSAVYSSTFLYWLGDESENNADTWDFLDRRIENVMQIEKLKAKCRSKKPKFPNIWRELGKKRYGS